MAGREASLAGMFGANPCVCLYVLAAASPDGAASEKPGLPPVLGGLYEIHSPNVTTGPR